MYKTKPRKKEFDILARNFTIAPDFVKQVNEEFKTTTTIEDYKMSELEFPLKKTEEIFNSKKNNENIIFNIIEDKIWEI